jgi:predicted enzyme related to lactoylglutathione lyase
LSERVLDGRTTIKIDISSDAKTLLEHPMSRNPFSHIDLRVRSFANVTDFYRALVPELGFTVSWGEDGVEWRGASTHESFPGKAFLWLSRVTEDPGHRPNASCITFWVNTREEVDRIGKVVGRAGGKNIEGPADSPEYSQDYYAVFFEDPDGNRFEVVHRTQ